jgi:hypothetical protein
MALQRFASAPKAIIRVNHVQAFAMTASFDNQRAHGKASGEDALRSACGPVTHGIDLAGQALTSLAERHSKRFARRRH